VVANLKRTVDDAAVDRAQLLAASNLIGQLFEAVELMKPEVNMATAEVKVRVDQSHASVSQEFSVCYTHQALLAQSALSKPSC
jgi:hypothetical protein